MGTAIKVKQVLQTFGSDQSYASSPFGPSEDEAQVTGLADYLKILKRRIFYFLLPFIVVAAAGLYFAAGQQPTYHSEGKVLVEPQEIAPDLVRPITTATASERLQVIQQRTMTRDNLLSIANRLRLFPDAPGALLLDLMRASTQIKLVDMDGPNRTNGAAIAFTVGFDHESPELAERATNELLTLILNEDARKRTSQAAETTKILQSEVKDLEDKLEANQVQIIDAQRRPREVVAEVPDQQRAQLAALDALKAELIQKTSIYADSHPAVISLRKRIAAMEKSITQPPAASPSSAQEPPTDDLVTLQRQREGLETRLEDANSKLAIARIGENLEKDQRSDRFQVIEQPTLPQRPLKSGRTKFAELALAGAVMAGFGGVLAAETFDRSIGDSGELSGIVDGRLITLIPYIETQAEARRRRRTIMLGLGLLLLLVLSAIAAAISYFVFDVAWFDRSWLDALRRPSR